MARIACLFVPDFPVVSLCRVDPELVGIPLAITDGPGPRASILAASPAARAFSLVPGRHSATQARAVAATVVLRPRNLDAETSGTNALVDVAASLATRIESDGNGLVYLDADGAGLLVPNEQALATALVARAIRMGLHARAGIGSTKTVARFAALHGDGTEVVPGGTERGFLAPLSIRSLAPDPAIVDTLARWGVHTLGALARLPTAEVATRLGATGAILVRTARGEDDVPLSPNVTSGDIEEQVSLEHPIDTVEPLLFVLRGLLERAIARLGLRGVGAARLSLTLGLEERRRDVRSVPLLAPTRDLKTFLLLLRTDIEAHPPSSAIVAVAVRLSPAAVQPVQLGLFSPPGPSPERLATTLARLAALCGADRVGTPQPVDSHCPGRADVAPFRPDVAPETSTHRDVSGVTCPLVVRACRPPRAIDVFSDRDGPSYVRGAGIGGRVVGTAGPWRVEGEWWTATPFTRDYYDLELSDGGIYRCFVDRSTGCWFVDGFYD